VPGGEHGKKNFRTVPADPAQGERIERGGRTAAPIAVIVPPFAVPVEVVAVPSRRRSTLADGRFQSGAAEYGLASVGPGQQR